MNKTDKEMKRRLDEARKGRGKRIWFVKGGLQGCDPIEPAAGAEDLGVIGENHVGISEGFGGKGVVAYDA